jgi:lipopolysaccharide export system protein LptA
MSGSDSTAQQLDDLREVYVYKVNAALERGREDLAAELADDYLDEEAREAIRRRYGDAVRVTAKLTAVP